MIAGICLIDMRGRAGRGGGLLQLTLFFVIYIKTLSWLVQPKDSSVLVRDERLSEEDETHLFRPAGEEATISARGRRLHRGGGALSSASRLHPGRDSKMWRNIKGKSDFGAGREPV